MATELAINRSSNSLNRLSAMHPEQDYERQYALNNEGSADNETSAEATVGRKHWASGNWEFY